MFFRKAPSSKKSPPINKSCRKIPKYTFWGWYKVCEIRISNLKIILRSNLAHLCPLKVKTDEKFGFLVVFTLQKVVFNIFLQSKLQYLWAKMLEDLKSPSLEKAPPSKKPPLNNPSQLKSPPGAFSR